MEIRHNGNKRLVGTFASGYKESVVVPTVGIPVSQAYDAFMEKLESGNFEGAILFCHGRIKSCDSEWDRTLWQERLTMTNIMLEQAQRQGSH